MNLIRQILDTSPEGTSEIKRELIDLAPLLLRPFLKADNNKLLENLLDKKEITFSVSSSDYPNVRPSEFFTAVNELPSTWNDEVETNLSLNRNELEATITLVSK